MCITLEPAKLSNTLIYAAEAQYNGEIRHVLGYQNKVWAKGGPNAMILPIPAQDPLGPANIIDTRKFKTILDSYDRAVEHLRPKRRDRRGGFGHDSLKLGAAAASFQVFESGSYTIALADKPAAIREALGHVPENKRPEIPTRFLLALGKLYKDWPIAVCCFNGDLQAPEPLLWWYKPRFPRVLFAPAIDAHDGNPPDPEIQVNRDHTLAFASYRSNRKQDINLVTAIQGLPAEHQWMFMPSVVGSKIEHRTGNGDFSLPVSAVLDERVPQYIPNIDITPPPRELPSIYDHILAGGAVG